jgi:hypothetical protein
VTAIGVPSCSIAMGGCCDGFYKNGWGAAEP